APALRALAERYRRLLDDESLSHRALCHAASLSRSHLDHRLAVVGASRRELAERLDAFLSGDGATAGLRRAHGTPKLVFLYPGQGSQWVGMGRALFAEEPAFRAAIA